jgi:Outer membrane protein beta-barrel domain
MRAHAVGLAVLLAAIGSHAVAAQTLEVTPLVGYETAGSYPPENPATVQRLRADAARTFGVMLDYPITDDMQLEFEWLDNPTAYSAQDAVTGQYSPAFESRIDQYQFGGLYFLRGQTSSWRPYIAATIGLTHDANGGDTPGRTAFGFGVGGGVKYPISRYFGLRADARWMPTYGSSGTAEECDEFGNCYPMAAPNYMQRFNVALGLTIRP